MEHDPASRRAPETSGCGLNGVRDPLNSAHDRSAPANSPMGHAPSAMFILRSVEARRLGIGLSIEKLCGLAGTSSGYYRNALAGEREMSDAMLARLTDALAGRAFEPPPPPAPPPPLNADPPLFP